MQIEETLRQARMDQKRSVESVAAEVGVHPNTIRYAESGRSKIAHITLCDWAHVLGYRVVLEPDPALELDAPTPEQPTPTDHPAPAGPADAQAVAG